MIKSKKYINDIIELSNIFKRNIQNFYEDQLNNKLFKTILTYSINENIPLEVFLKFIDEESLDISESTLNSISVLSNNKIDIKKIRITILQSKKFSNYQCGLRLRYSKMSIKYIEKVTKEHPKLVNINSSDWIFN